MYSESDIDGAVAAGVLPSTAAQAFRDHVAAMRQSPAVDEESFRLLTGFNDIFVSIALILLLVATSWIGQAIAAPLSGAAVAAASWGLAEYFTRERRMALPSILLLIAFIGGVASTLVSLLMTGETPLANSVESITSEAQRTAVAGMIAAMIAGITAAAAWLHWRRFAVPITIAAGAAAIVTVVISLVIGFVPATRDAIYWLVLTAGVALFAFAMRWDMSDRERRTRRSDVAFWLHLTAAPMIAHALFNVLGVFDGDVGIGKAVVVLLLYVAFAFVALAVDRRALLVSSLAYVLYAMYALFQQAGAVELSAAFTAFIIGSALLTLSAFWQTMRRSVVATLGTWQHRLPPVAPA